MSHSFVERINIRIVSYGILKQLVGVLLQEIIIPARSQDG